MAKIDRADREYYDELIRPLMKRSDALVEFIGEISDREKPDWAVRSLLLDWPEPLVSS